MELTDVTPEWITARRDALGLRNVEIYSAIGMPQSAFSRIMSGHRRIQTAEAAAIYALLGGDAAKLREPRIARLTAIFPKLPPEQQEHVLRLAEMLAGKPTRDRD